MPAVDDPFSIAASLPGQMATLKGVVKDASVNNTQVLSQSLAAATASAASASSASAAATTAANAATTASNAATTASGAATTASNAATAAATAATNASVTAAVGHASVSSYAITTTPLELTRATITVPTGYTKALVFGTSSATFVNQHNTLGDFVKGYIDINGASAPVSGGQFVQPILDVTIVVSYSYLLTALTGGSTFYVRCVYYNEQNVMGAASTRNICNLDATVTFLR